MKLVYQALLTSSSLFVSFSSYAADPIFQFTGTAAFTTDYIFRGITQTDSGPAVQGSLDLRHQNGVYAGIWGSNVKFLEDETVKPEDRADLEIDLYLGYNRQASSTLSYGFKAGYYAYPSAGKDLNYDLTEFEISLGYAMSPEVKFSFAYDYSPEFAGKSGQAHHYLLTANQTYANGMGFSIQVGQQSVSDNAAFGRDDYRYYGVSLSYAIANFNTILGYSNTDLDDAGDSADSRVFFTVSRTF